MKKLGIALIGTGGRSGFGEFLVEENWRRRLKGIWWMGQGS